jgi:hypothetical protein
MLEPVEEDLSRPDFIGAIIKLRFALADLNHSANVLLKEKCTD